MNNSKYTYDSLSKAWTRNIKEIIAECIEYDELDNFDDIYDRTNELIWERIDSDSDVIYTYNAKMVSDCLDFYGAFDEWDVTGERFDNWSQVAFANIYHLCFDELDINDMIHEAIEHFNL